jgi:uncharacterized protein YndB with AHSA1/START domain
MKQLQFKTQIAADRKKVWNTMLQPDSYKEWAGSAWPGSIYEGKWAQNEDVRFVSPGQGGTLATVAEHKPFESTLLRHTAMINANGTEDRESDIAKGWVGTTEKYIFAESNGKTDVTVEINTFPSWEKMFSNDWPTALAKLKEICEK